MGEYPDKMPPDSELVRELNLTNPQWRLTATYWDRRIMFARNQRNTLLGLIVMVVAQTLIKSLGGIEPSASAFESLVDIFYRWLIPAFLVLATVVLVLGEVAIHTLNRSISKGLPSDKLKRIISLGNEVATHTLLFRKTERK